MRNWHRLLIIGLGVIALAAALALIAPWGQDPVAANGTIHYVDVDATTGGNNGSTWADAFTDLQDALGAAVDGNEIWVAEGTYTPATEHGGTGDRFRSFQLINGVALYGGFDPDAGDTEWEDRDWESNPTILSGDLNGDDGPDFANNDENSYHVFYHPDGTNLDSTAILDGFTITGGNANDSGFPHNVGGGMLNYFSSPTLTNCTFSSNSANFGGGMFNSHSTPILADCAFMGNSAASLGGGMLNSESPSPVLTNCTFAGNSAGWGGGMYNDDSPPVLTNCTFSGNSADSEGGGMFNGASSPTLINCIFWGNSAGWGGGIRSETADIGWPVLTNCILWDNSPNQIWDDGDSPVTYSDIQGGYTGGEGNIDAYPFFVDPGNGDFHLLTCSPCIDAGDNEAGGLPDYDFEGDDRIVDGDDDGTAIVDMGVDEGVDGLPCLQIYLPVVRRGY